jgi:hypothetical protein
VVGKKNDVSFVCFEKEKLDVSASPNLVISNDFSTFINKFKKKQ